ncbi:NAD-glutamate dehydrogenase [Streptoalloteichus tenebrarius]|uniref:NAD-glutamate dehydrogenase n=1 Tax=Streptoalloteichus tenebrarius (strain ATCC 17920 / DSM 40477 / JCM 4838 / CBS 697.72 / NBRC 16177 / NCIMB 11028 / NRRL B-12390 / A12253. 1 / ISP 5477) TaxID=1933 RepID=A0ABT1HUX6_STRSD|nr:NAD-glutamate dehydrogenase [Streptoalloteichus tenebrarius]BFE99085.1 hypothetical protein GCM10020241_07610 [Streptoalloteichus tenebrarius]
MFLDPDPNPSVSFRERKRLVELPRSSWDDHDRSKISKGGGVFPRTLKSIPVSPQVREALGLPDGVSRRSSRADQGDPWPPLRAGGLRRRVPAMAELALAHLERLATEEHRA